MSRVFTIVVILGLLAVVALVPQMGREELGDQRPGLGDGYAYQADTLRRFRLLLEDPGWSLAEPPRNPQGMLEAAHEKTGLTFVLIPAGSFMMGSPEDDARTTSWEEPIHPVEVPAFLMCKTECAQRPWERGGGKNDSLFRGGDRPVEQVKWENCRAWCKKNRLRLPSEAEWEYACRAGTTSPFSFGEKISPEQVNYNAARPSARVPQAGFRDQTVAVGSLPPNPWGLHEMHGNVYEFCEDDWHNSYEGAPSDGSAWKTGDTSVRVGRGGCWLIHAPFCRSACRVDGRSLRSSSILGFRPAADIPK